MSDNKRKSRVRKRKDERFLKHKLKNLASYDDTDMRSYFISKVDKSKKEKISNWYNNRSANEICIFYITNFFGLFK